MAAIKTKYSNDDCIRICRLCTWSNYNGFGFSLDASVPLPPYIIQSVESHSPAVAGGLRIHDVLLFVNNYDISSMTYDELKEIIRTSQSSSNRLELLVIAKDAHALLSQEDIFIKAASAKIIETPRVMPIEYKYFHKYQPRTCIIDLHEKDTSFGLTIAEGENKIGLFIEEIKPKSPASKTSLRKYDRIIEINDKYVDNDSSDSILKKLNKAETRRSVKLYVVDTETYRYFKANKIPLSSSGLRKSQSIKLFQEMNNKHLTLKNQSTPNRTEPSKVHHISNPEISILQEDIRLCTILRTNSRDPPGFVIDYNQKERSHVLNIVRSCQNRLSDAELAGIKPNDRLIEINGKNIENLTNEEIKQRIHAIKYPNSLQLLVVDVPTYHYYQQQNKRIYRKLSNVCILPPNIPSPSNIPPPRPTDPKPTSLLNTSKSKESSILSSQPRIIIIKKCSNSFGFNFHTISNENSLYSHVITSIDVNFPINLSNLHLNDYILSINNENIEHFTHEQLINLLDRLNNNETILLLVAEKTIYQQYLEILRMNKLSKHNSSKNIRQYRLKANQNFENYGFSVQTKGISFRIISIKPLSPASNAGLSIGDYIVRVNNQLVVKMKLDKLISLIQDETKIIDGHLLLEVTNEDTYRSISLYPQIRLCTIRSWAHYKDLGFEIIRATNILTNDQAYRIQQLQLESPAAYTQVYNGDYIIEVNEQNIEEKTLHDVYQLIGYSYHQEGRVTLLIVDDHGYKWYRDNRIQIDPSSEKLNLIRHTTPEYSDISISINSKDKFPVYTKVEERFLDVQYERQSSRLSIEGYESIPLVSLVTAVEHLDSIVHRIKQNALIALDRSMNPSDGLTNDESAAIQLYTMEWSFGSQSLYAKLNGALRAEDRIELRVYLLYLKLLLTGLCKLKSVEQTVWRGVRMDLSTEYPVGKTIVWWGFSSCTDSLHYLKSNRFVGQIGVRTLFNIECKTGKSIGAHSYFQKEKEILLLPATQFQVIGQLNPGNGLHIIHLRETHPEYSLLHPLFS